MFRVLASASLCLFSLLLTGPAGAQTAPPPAADVSAPLAMAVSASAEGRVESIPRAERARARQDCLSDNIALTGEDLRQAMRDCLQAKFPHVRLYARDGVTRDGRPTMAAARAACKEEADRSGLVGAARRQALVACFGSKRPDIAQRAECRKDVRQQGLTGELLRQALEACGREGRS